MDRSRPASDRVRPFLEAMERSIDSVRRQRLEDSGELTPAEAVAPAPPVAPATTPAPEVVPPSPLRPTHVPAVLNGDQPKAGPARLKARPKRSTSFNNNQYNRDDLSQAG